MPDITVKDRWLGAVCYVGCLVFIPILTVKEKSDFLAGHCRQGFALFFVEVVLYVFLHIFDATLGRLPLIGLLLTIVLHLAAMVACLTLSVIGFVKALSGETCRLPGVDELAERVPIK
jgi:uncharacterized membrane protein